jgi:mono/diheme cytochrome c family protein
LIRVISKITCTNVKDHPWSKLLKIRNAIKDVAQGLCFPAFGNVIFVATDGRSIDFSQPIGRNMSETSARLFLGILTWTVLFSGYANAQSDPIARGEYLTRAADCVACHTAPGGKPFAGGRAFELPFGTLYSPNITPDPTSGIAGYSDDEWVRMLHEGIARDGKHLYPAMPYTSYTLMSRDDALLIKAYLMSLQPLEASIPQNKISFPFNQRWGLAFWNFFNSSNRRFEPDSKRSAEYNRGDYLVNALAHCGECHTPRNFMMGLKSGKQFAGEEQEGWLAYNLTSDPVHGLGKWSDKDLEAYLATGHAEGHGPASGPMAEAVGLSLRYLQPSDIHAIVAYLREVSPQPDGPPAVFEASPINSTDGGVGAKFFAQACEGCHLRNGEGRQSPWASLLGSHSAGDSTGKNMLQVLISGTQLDTSTGRVLMHPFSATAYSDVELAAVANYVANQFAGRPANVTAEQVRHQRESSLGTQ